MITSDIILMYALRGCDGSGQAIRTSGEKFVISTNTAERIYGLKRDIYFQFDPVDEEGYVINTEYLDRIDCEICGDRLRLKIIFDNGEIGAHTLTFITDIEAKRAYNLFVAKKRVRDNAAITKELKTTNKETENNRITIKSQETKDAELFALAVLVQASESEMRRADDDRLRRGLASAHGEGATAVGRAELENLLRERKVIQ